MGQYDRIMKLLVDREPEAVARFVLNEWQKQRGTNPLEIQVTSVVLLSEEFQSEELKGDGVWLIYGPDGPQLLTSADLLKSELYNILPIGNAVASWFLRGSDLSWLNEEYQRMYEIFKDAPAIKWIQEDGRADERRIAAEERKKLIVGFQETEEKYKEERKKLIAEFRETVVSMVSQQYPKLKRLAKNQVRLVEDVGRIRQLIVDLNAVRNSDEAQDVLLSVTDNVEEKDTDAIEVIQMPPTEP